MSTNDTYDITTRQKGTNESSAAAMLDSGTESRLYELFRAFFQESEQERNWNLWKDIPWQEVTKNPPTELIDAIFALFHDHLFLPDYSAKSLHILRSSRGRAWFWTRWSYEEGKHLLTWIDWLTSSGAYTDEYLRQYANRQLEEYRWEPPVKNNPGIFWDSLLWEQREIARLDAALPLAEAAGDGALIDALGKIRRDEVAQSDFLRACLRTIQEKYAPLVAQSAAEVASINEIPGGAAALLGLLK